MNSADNLFDKHRGRFLSCFHCGLRAGFEAVAERPHTALDKRTPDIAYFTHAQIRKAA